MYRLSEYQTQGLKYCLLNPFPALLWKMRLRKTIVAIRTIKIKQLYPCLIICPNSAIGEWKEQLTNDGFINMMILTGAKRKREIALEEGFQFGFKIFIINHEGYRSLPEIGTFPYKSVILDESHAIRNNCKFSKFCINNFRQAEMRMILTGTSMPESELDIFNQLHFLDYSFIYPYRNYWEFRHDCFFEDNHKFTINSKGRKWLSEKLNKCSILEYATVGIKERLTEVVREIELDNVSRKQYDRLFKEFILEDDYVQKSTISSGARYVWMRQLLGGFIEDKFVQSRKYLELANLLDNDLKDQKVVIWSRYNNEVKLLSTMLVCPFISGDADIKERDFIKKEFQSGNDRIIVCNPYCFAHGGNLSIADAEVYYSLPESGLIFNQSKMRIFNIDQKQIKLCIYLIVKDSIEEVILQAQKRKLSVSKEIFEYSQRMKKCILK
jgi:SWI/SNF-related matrix-associated actin-dependent regulator 1 of chromatin subfamily A